MKNLRINILVALGLAFLGSSTAFAAGMEGKYQEAANYSGASPVRPAKLREYTPRVRKIIREALRRQDMNVLRDFVQKGYDQDFTFDGEDYIWKRKSLNVVASTDNQEIMDLFLARGADQHEMLIAVCLMSSLEFANAQFERIQNEEQINNIFLSFVWDLHQLYIQPLNYERYPEMIRLLVGHMHRLSTNEAATQAVITKALNGSKAFINNIENNNRHLGWFDRAKKREAARLTAAYYAMVRALVESGAQVSPALSAHAAEKAKYLKALVPLANYLREDLQQVEE